MKIYKYEVNFDAARSYNWFYTRIYWVENDEKTLIAEKACCRDHKRAAKWARKKINDYEDARHILSGVLKP